MDGEMTERSICEPRQRSMITFRIARECAFLDFLFVAAKSLERIRLEMGIGFDKLRHEVVKQSEEVIEDQDLAVTVGTGPDSNCRNGQLFRNGLGQLGRNRFEHDSEGAGCFEGLRIIQKNTRTI